MTTRRMRTEICIPTSNSPAAANTSPWSDLREPSPANSVPGAATIPRKRTIFHTAFTPLPGNPSSSRTQLPAPLMIPAVSCWSPTLTSATSGVTIPLHSTSPFPPIPLAQPSAIPPTEPCPPSQTGALIRPQSASPPLPSSAHAPTKPDNKKPTSTPRVTSSQSMSPARPNPQATPTTGATTTTKSTPQSPSPEPIPRAFRLACGPFQPSPSWVTH